jgi:hypothetical protein
MDNNMLMLAGALVGAFLVFVVLREFATWYWKQSEQVQLLKSIAASVAALEERTRNGAPAPALPKSGFDTPVKPRPTAVTTG